MNALTRRIAVTAAAAVIFTVGAVAANKYGKPKSIIHVVTLYWKDGTTPEQKQKVFAATEKMAADFKGIKNLWLKSVKVQGDAGGKQLQSAFVIEFKDAAAFKEYETHPAHKAWEEVYLPLRGESRTHDITNE